MKRSDGKRDQTRKKKQEEKRNSRGEIRQNSKGVCKANRGLLFFETAGSYASLGREVENKT